MDKKLEKLKFLEKGFYTFFQKTGNPYFYGRVCGTRDLIKEREMELKEQNGREM